MIIPKECGVSNEVSAKGLSVGIATVVRMQRRIRDQVDGKEEEKSSWAGRRRQTMSIEAESEFFRPWVEKAETRGVLVVHPIRAALEDRLGRPVAPSTVYRMLLAPKMNTINMSAFLNHVSQRHPDDFVAIVLDGASSHRSQDLRVPENIAIVRLPPYSPELNPAERLWNDIREKEFANRVFVSLGAAIAQAAMGLKRLEKAPEALRSLTGIGY